MLRQGVRRTMTLAGARTIADVGPELVTRRPR
jgi:hypothetical protein